MAKIAQGAPPASPDTILASASRCLGAALLSMKTAATPFPSWIAPGHFTATAAVSPSSFTPPYAPWATLKATAPWQKPIVGRALKLQGHP